MDSVAAESPSPPANLSRKLRRQRSRLQMLAPPSIQLCPATPRDVSQWKFAIPLLSPLDSPPIMPPPQQQVVAAARDMSALSEWQWKHPTAPFYYESVPANASSFVVRYLRPELERESNRISTSSSSAAPPALSAALGRHAAVAPARSPLTVIENIRQHSMMAFLIANVQGTTDYEEAFTAFWCAI